MYCMKCGAPVADGTTLCKECGAVEQVQATPAIVTPATDWKDSRFDGCFWGWFGMSLLCRFVSVISLGFAWPAMHCAWLRWLYKHTCVGGYRLQFNGRGVQLFGKYVLWCFLSIITIGIFTLWLPIKYRRWEISHVEIQEQIPVRED